MNHLELMLSEARKLIGAAPTDGQNNMRSAAIVTRQVLEEALVEYMEKKHDKIRQPNFNAILVTLEYLSAEQDKEILRQVAWTWSALSNACHAHAYALEPTAAEVERWIEVVDKFLKLG